MVKIRNQFLLALESQSLQLIKMSEKGDCHNHVSRGGSVQDYKKVFGIPEYEKPERFDGLDSMENWYSLNIRK